MIEGILLATVSFILFLLLHFALFYFWPPRKRWKTVSSIAWVCFIVYSALFWVIPFSNWFQILNLDSHYARFLAYANGLLIYIFLFFSYGQVYFLVDRGVSGRILVDIEESQDKMLSLEEIRRRYDPYSLQKRRLDDMIYGKYVVMEDGKYRATWKGKLLARVFIFMKKLLHLYPGG